MRFIILTQMISRCRWDFFLYSSLSVFPNLFNVFFLNVLHKYADVLNTKYSHVSTRVGA